MSKLIQSKEHSQLNQTYIIESTASNVGNTNRTLNDSETEQIQSAANENTPIAIATRRVISNTQRQPNSNDEPKDDNDDEIVLKYGAKHVIMIFVPVSACMLLVIISLAFIKSYQSGNGTYLIYTPFHEDTTQASTKLWQSLANASIFIGVVIVMTIVLIILYKFSCYRIIHGWLALSSLLLLFLFTYMYVSEFVKAFNLVVDFATIILLMWNFGCIGMICIHWMGPLRLQQTYLILVCSQMALIFVKYLPDWTTWVLLAFISIWDLVAVLCPFGPLRILVETAKSRNDKLFPALIYSSTIMYSLVFMANETNINQQAQANIDIPINNDDDNGGFNETEENRRRPIRNRNQQQELNDIQADNYNVRIRSTASSSTQNRVSQQSTDEENGVKLGLGDFIFYSVLVGKASILGDWNTVIACFVAILIGLCFTLVLLAIFHKALPALPISLTFGLIFYFCTNSIVRPFYDNLAQKQYFI